MQVAARLALPWRPARAAACLLALAVASGAAAGGCKFGLGGEDCPEAQPDSLEEVPARASIEVPYHAQETDCWCWAAVTQSLAEHFGVTFASQCDLVSETQWQPVACLRDHCSCDASHEAVETAGCDVRCVATDQPRFDVFGYVATQSPATVFCPHPSGHPSWDLIRDELGRAGRPMVTEWTWNESGCEQHVVILTGYHEDGGTRWIDFLDPNGEDAPPVEQSITFEAWVGGYEDGNDRIHAYSWHGIVPGPRAQERGAALPAIPRPVSPSLHARIEHFEPITGRHPFPPPALAWKGPTPDPVAVVAQVPARERVRWTESVVPLGALAGFQPGVRPESLLAPTKDVIVPALKPPPRGTVGRARKAGALPVTVDSAAGSWGSVVMRRKGKSLRPVIVRTAAWTDGVLAARRALAAREHVRDEDISLVRVRGIGENLLLHRSPAGQAFLSRVTWSAAAPVGLAQPLGATWLRLQPRAAAALRGMRQAPGGLD